HFPSPQGLSSVRLVPYQNLIVSLTLAQCLKQLNLWNTFQWISAGKFHRPCLKITPIRKLKWKSPYQLWYGQPFDTSRLKPFGCLAFVKIPNALCNRKFRDMAVGYQQGANNWHVLLPGGKVLFLQLQDQHQGTIWF
ncbi:uncharacterized protein VP01_5740g1, partial [Puccinia sorghi]